MDLRCILVLVKETFTFGNLGQDLRHILYSSLFGLYRSISIKLVGVIFFFMTDGTLVAQNEV